MTLGEAVLVAQRLASAAKEECARGGRPEVDVDHLLLALVLSGGPAGQLLRGLGVTVDAARAAVERVHADRAARLGVTLPSLPARRIPDPSRGRIDWSRRAKKALKATSSRPDELTVLGALLDEPSGLVRDVLQVLQLPEDGLLRAVAEPSEGAGPEPRGGDPAWQSADVEGFAPAPVDQVWALVTDPGRRQVWDSAHESLVARWDGVLEGRAATVRPNGSRARVSRDFRRTELRVVRQEPGRLVEWELSWPDRARSRSQRLSVQLEPAPGGTRVVLARRWQAPRGVRALAQRVAGPLHRIVVRSELQGSAAALSRALR